MGFGSLAAAHTTLAWVALIGNGAAAAWALAAHRLKQLRVRAMWWFVALVQVLLVVEVALGVGLQAGQGRAVPGIHTFYGFITLAAVGILFSYRGHLSRTRRHLLYGWGGLFITGLVIRTMIIG